MKKQDNPVFIFGVLTAAVFLVIAGWVFLPWFNKDSGSTQVSVVHNRVEHDSLPCFLVLSDIHLHSSLIQDDIADSDADTGHDLWDTAQNKIKRLLAGKEGFAPPKFIIVLGDLPWHAHPMFKNELESARDNSGKVLSDLRLLAENANIPLIYVSGNNDPWEGDYHPFSTEIFKKDTGGKICWPIIHPLPLDTTIATATVIDDSKLSLGCYSAYPLGKKGKLRVIALNTTIFSHKYTDKDHQSADATSQINWLDGQLEQAAIEKEYVLIAMHMPPGLDGFMKKDFWHKTTLNNDTPVENAFLDLIDKYQDRIVGLLSSHTHMDGIRKLYNRDGKLTAVDISLPGIAPGHGNNPGIKMISYNPTNFELQNFITLYMPYFQNKKVVSWGNDEFDFGNEFGCPKGTSIRSCLDTLKTETLQKAVQSIYKVKNGLGKTDEVNSAIEVRYE